MMARFITTFAAFASAAIGLFAQEKPAQQGLAPLPNIVLIITDDHSYQTLGTCEKDSPVPLPNFHRLADEGMVFDRSYCANSLCGPSRACIYTGRHSHMNGFLANAQGKPFDGSQPTFPKMLQKAGYQTAVFGKWHLESNPTGFDHWEIFPNQGSYYNPDFISLAPNGKKQVLREPGYATELVTKKSLNWLDQRDPSKPFMLVVGHKAPHRNWNPAIKNLGKIKSFVEKLNPPSNLEDNFDNRPGFLKKNQQSLQNHFAVWSDEHLIKELIPQDLQKQIVCPGYGWGMGELNRMSPQEKEAWLEYYRARTKSLVADLRSGKIKTKSDILKRRWQHYMEDYLSTLLSVDESVGEIIDYLDKNKLSENTIVLYCGDQGFFMGEHGWYDKRWILEESFRMPLIMRWPGRIKAGVRSQAMVQEIDYAPTFCSLAGINTPENMNTFQGRSLIPLFKTGADEAFADRPLYYAFYENPGEHNAPRHDGIRTQRYTFARIWTSDEWMMFDNEKDPKQMNNVYGSANYAQDVQKLNQLYHQARSQYQVPDNLPGVRGKLDVTPRWNCAPANAQ